MFFSFSLFSSNIPVFSFWYFLYTTKCAYTQCFPYFSKWYISHKYYFQYHPKCSIFPKYIPISFSFVFPLNSIYCHCLVPNTYYLPFSHVPNFPYFPLFSHFSLFYLNSLFPYFSYFPNPRDHSESYKAVQDWKVLSVCEFVCEFVCLWVCEFCMYWDADSSKKGLCVSRFNYGGP